MPLCTRRTFLATASCSAVLASTGYASSLPQPDVADAPLTLRLWPNVPPGGGGPADQALYVTSHGSISHISTPVLQVYRPEKPNGSAILLAAGGGYRQIVIRHEAVPATAWLTALGMTVFVLTYRLPDEGWHAGRLAPFQDAQRAIRLIKSNAHQYGINPDQLGLLGFSAGGHLMGMCATRPAWQTYTPVDEVDHLPLTVRYAMLAYPVVTLCPPYDTTQTRRSMVGAHPTEAEAEAWSVQTYVTDKSPPFFLVHAADDRIAKAPQTEILQQACVQHHVPVTRYLLETGGHGFSLNEPYKGTAWSLSAEKWLHKQHLVPV
ncbi:MAG: alpha/beta hydrolase [Acetobacter cibinongensis]